MAYDARIIHNTHLKISPEYRNTDHSVRVLAFNNGMIVVAWMTNGADGTVHCVHPMELFMTLDHEDSIVEYEFVPYLENLAEFDIDKAYNFVFPIASLQSVTVPTDHVLNNYMAQLLFFRKMTDDMNGIQDAETLH